MTKGMRGGFTLVEVMLAGAIAVFMTLALMEGLVVSAKISHENSELLAADAFAWDTAWKWLNKSYKDLPDVKHTYDSVTDTAMAMTTNDCPVLNFEHAGGDPRVVVTVDMCDGTNVVVRHGTNVKVKRIDVDVEWGPAGDRKRLSQYKGVSVYKSQIDRGVPE